MRGRARGQHTACLGEPHCVSELSPQASGTQTRLGSQQKRCGLRAGGIGTSYVMSSDTVAHAVDSQVFSFLLGPLDQSSGS